MDFPDIMVDVETTGTSPDRGGILQLSAIRFNLRERQVDGANLFDGYLALPPTRFWEEGTRNYWTHPDRIERLREMLGKLRNPAIVLAEFRDWAGAGGPSFWSWRQFDFAFVAGYFRDFDIANPFHYANAIEQTAFQRGLGFPGSIVEPHVEFVGRKHDAVYDAAHQIKKLFAACDAVKGGVLVE
jgi:hypothetical protein